MILKRVKKRFNLVRREGKAPGNWAGSKHFQQQGNILIDPNTNQPLQYLHWAGIKIEPGCPYWDIWYHYRYLNDPHPPELIIGESSLKGWQGFLGNLKGKLGLINGNKG